MSSRAYGSLAGLVLMASDAIFTAYAATWVPVPGSVRTANGTPICAMVLANGQYMFSCDGTGAYNLTVPLDSNGQITLFSFADGFAPFRTTILPAALPVAARMLPIQMETAAPDSPLIATTRNMQCASTPSWVHITGTVESYSRQPLCAMVLANGQQMFTCGDSEGNYDLTVPVDENGQVTLFGFADGFQPYRDTFIAPVCSGSNSAENAVNPSSPLIGRCEQVSRGNSTVRLTNSGSTMIEAYFDSVPFGADIAPGECILVGIELPSSYTLQGNLEVTQCTPSPPEEGGCDTLFGPTKYAPIVLREGQTQTINVGSNFF